ncbi:hypothetical protein CICLE_v10017305mg [Citrus x clementina]|uniref:Uncharacterized protein n=1 Tax=Citrus clementina TaxID=85681 RepID=V4U948_CITCL|nr:hypothetical protein CICLE_v10017305mg [Citrus x clementina]
MGLMRSLEWVNSYGQRKCRSLFWRVRAALKNAVKTGGKQHFKFQYDPSSYALNFDDGRSNYGLGANGVKQAQHQDCSESKNVMWVCVLWVESQ